MKTQVKKSKTSGAVEIFLPVVVAMKHTIKLCHRSDLSLYAPCKQGKIVLYTSLI